MAFETDTEIVKVRLPDGIELNFETTRPGGERKVGKLEDVLDCCGNSPHGILSLAYDFFPNAEHYKMRSKLREWSLGADWRGFYSAFS